MPIRTLVAAQFLLSALLVLSAEWWPLHWGVISAAAPGVLLAIWAWFRVGLTRIRILPQANASTELIVEGPFRIVRHPMYTGLLWMTAMTLLTPYSSWRVIAWLALVVILVQKVQLEERSLTKTFSEYAGYQTRVGKFIPRLR